MFSLYQDQEGSGFMDFFFNKRNIFIIRMHALYSKLPVVTLHYCKAIFGDIYRLFWVNVPVWKTGETLDTIFILNYIFCLLIVTHSHIFPH